jgi:diaminohydroxyphosphoribosylaminopyrimidine deaminase / 5-amino-6-(5-phosphoribosylamino)uracil reductase
MMLTNGLAPLLARSASSDDAATAATDLGFMRLALDVARRGRPAPNPPVGAVLVRGGRILGCGWHERAGGLHAEVAALHSAGLLARDAARGATLYVTLEPCNHFGRTPPCTDALLHAGIARVVFACNDPNCSVAGGGARRLSAAGIAVSSGLCGAEGSELIAGWVAKLGR